MANAISIYFARAAWIAIILTATTSLFAQTNDSTVALPNFPNLATIRSRAGAGNAAAQGKLGDYHMAQGDTTNAFFWYRVAAENGDPEAQTSLAACYLYGRGVTQNIPESMKWQRMATTQRSNKPMVGRLADQGMPVTRTVMGRIQKFPPMEATLESAGPGLLQKPFDQTFARSEMMRISDLPTAEPELEDVQLQPRPAE